MIRLTCILLFLGTKCLASNLTLNNSILAISDQPTRMDCNGMSVVSDEQTSCCIGNSCVNQSLIEFSKNNNSCPKIVIDGYQYELLGPIDIHHDLQLFLTQSNTLQNCLNGNNQAPTLGTGFLAVVNAETVGVHSSRIDVNTWSLIITTIDGDVHCDGGIVFNDPDVIFKNSFN